MACCLRRATCAAITLCLSTTSRQFAHWQSRQRHKRLWPLRRDTTPWFLQRAHFGLRLSLRGAGASPVLILSPSMSSAHSAWRGSMRVTSTCESLSALLDIYKPFSWTDAAHHMQAWYFPITQAKESLIGNCRQEFWNCKPFSCAGESGCLLELEGASHLACQWIKLLSEWRSDWSHSYQVSAHLTHFSIFNFPRCELLTTSRG